MKFPCLGFSLALFVGAAACDAPESTTDSLSLAATIGRWVTVTDGVAPAGMYVAARENGQPLGVCVASYQGGAHGGKIIGGRCNLGWGGQEVVLSSYEALVDVPAGSDLWISSSLGGRSVDTLQGGHEADGTPQFVCRAFHNGAWHPGKLLGDQCRIGWGGAEVGFGDYQVLVLRPAPTTTVTAFDAQPLRFGPDNWRERDATVTFPSGSYRSITLRLSLSCPQGGCDPWDRFGSFGLVGAGGQVIELARFNTPYGVGGSWSYDVTDLRPLLSGEVTLRAFIDTWVSSGWLVTARFEMTAGTPAREAIAAIPLWNLRDVPYGDPAQPVAGAAPARSIDLPAGAHALAVRSFVTGHGQGNGDNCAEFCPRHHTLTVAGTPRSARVWYDDCDQNFISTQRGNWRYARAGWCPGADVQPWVVDAPVPSSGDLVTVSYDVEAYENTCRPEAASCEGCVFGTSCQFDAGLHTPPHYKLSAVLIVYR